MKKWPESKNDMEHFKKKVLTNEAYLNTIISEDGKIKTIVIESNNYTNIKKDEILDDFEDGKKNDSNKGIFLSDEENSEFVRSIENILKKYRTSNYKIFIAGSPLVNHHLKLISSKEAAKFLLISILGIIIILFLIFRRIFGVLIPLFIVIISILSTVSIMVIVSLVSQIFTHFFTCSRIR